jgi:hypothetical protein
MPEELESAFLMDRLRFQGFKFVASMRIKCIMNEALKYHIVQIKSFFS